MFTWWETPNVFNELTRIKRELEQVWDRPQASPGHQGVFPLVNIYDNGEVYRIRAEIPGVEPSSLEVSATADSVVVKGERKDSRPEKASFHRRERDFGTFNRSIQLAQTISPDKVQASFQNGVLLVTVPRAEESKPRKVKVEL